MLAGLAAMFITEHRDHSLDEELFEARVLFCSVFYRLLEMGQFALQEFNLEDFITVLLSFHLLSCDITKCQCFSSHRSVLEMRV